MEGAEMTTFLAPPFRCSLACAPRRESPRQAVRGSTADAAGQGQHR